MATAKKFSSVVLHETRQLTVRTVRNKIELILPKKRLDEFEQMWDSGSSEITLSMDIFQQVIHLNWTKIFGLLWYGHAPKNVTFPQQAIEDNGRRKDPRFTTVFLNIERK